MQDYLRVTLFEHGNTLKLTGYGTPGNNNTHRKAISGFTKGSRQRLMRTMSTIDQYKIIGTPLFLTLTYPAVYSLDPLQWKIDLDTFAKRLIRKYPEIVIIWRMEFQKRGAPHYHCMLLNCSKTRNYWMPKDMVPFLNTAWFESVGSGNADHFAAGINVQPIKSFRHLISYVSKYISKYEEKEIDVIYPDGVGRFWGIINREYMPISPIEVELTIEEFHKLRRISRRFMEHKVDRSVFIYNTFSGMTIYIDYHNAFKLMEFVKDEPS